MTVTSIHSLWLRGLFSIAVLSYLGAQVDIKAALSAAASVDALYLVAVLVLVALDRMVMVARWLLVLRSSGQRLGLASLTRIFLVSSFLGSALPTSVGADALRAYQLSSHTDNPSEAIASVAIDRLVGFFTLTLLAILGTTLWGSASDTIPRAWFWSLIVLVTLLVGGLLFADHLVRSFLPSRWHTSSIVMTVLRLTDALSRYRDRRGILAGTFSLSLAVHLLRVSQAYLLGQGLDLTVPFLYYLAFMPIALLIFLLPVSIAGVGLPQGVIVWLLAPLGVTDDLSFALSTLLVLTGLAGNLPGAWLYARSKNALEETT